MSDTTAVAFAGMLVLMALASYRWRDTLQPNRTGAALYLAGSLAWGVAVLMLWAAWASTGTTNVCADGACDQLTGTFDSADVPAELLAGPEVLSEALTE
jgi:hypothetical protein